LKLNLKLDNGESVYVMLIAANLTIVGIVRLTRVDERRE
jgi:hypothetical protein